MSNGEQSVTQGPNGQFVSATLSSERARELAAIGARKRREAKQAEDEGFVRGILAGLRPLATVESEAARELVIRGLCRLSKGAGLKALRAMTTLADMIERGAPLEPPKPEYTFVVEPKPPELPKSASSGSGGPVAVAGGADPQLWKDADKPTSVVAVTPARRQSNPRPEFLIGADNKFPLTIIAGEPFGGGVLGRRLG